MGPGQAMQGKSWAKVRLTRGQSAGGVWEIDQQYPQARLAIGSDPNAGWAVQGPGVRPMHFELYWDGRCLFVADTQRVGGVALNGMPLTDHWTQVRGRGEVVFGQAAMAIETSEGQAAGMPDAALARRISPAEGPSASHNIAELTGEATRMTDSPAAWDPVVPMSSETTRIQDSPLDVSPRPLLGGPPPPPPPPPPGQRPRLGGNDGGPMGQAKTLMQDDLAGAVGEATRMVAMPDTPSIVVAPGMGMPAQRVHMGGPQPMQMGGPPQQMQMGGPPQQIQMGMPPQPMQMGQISQPMGSISGQQAPFGGAPAAQGGFAAPPGFGEGPPPMVKQPMKLPFGLTPRTAAMVSALSLAIVVLAIVGLYDDEEDYGDDTTQIAVPPEATSVAAPPPSTGYVPPSGVPTYVQPTYVPPSGVPTYVQPTYVQPTYVPPSGVYVPPPTPVYAPPATAVVLPPPTLVDPLAPLPTTPERMAADQVLAGRYSDALPLYQALAQQHPERPEYSAMVGILEQRIRAAQCVNGIGPDGTPCAYR